MRFIERWINLSPDGGDGTFEFALLAAGAVCLLLLVFRKRIRTAISSILDATDVTTANQKSVTGRSEIR